MSPALPPTLARTSNNGLANRCLQRENTRLAMANDRLSSNSVVCLTSNHLIKVGNGYHLKLTNNICLARASNCLTRNHLANDCPSRANSCLLRASDFPSRENNCLPRVTDCPSKTNSRLLRISNRLLRINY